MRRGRPPYHNRLRFIADYDEDLEILRGQSRLPPGVYYEEHLNNPRRRLGISNDSNGNSLERYEAPDYIQHDTELTPAENRLNNFFNDPNTLRRLQDPNFVNTLQRLIQQFQPQQSSSSSTRSSQASDLMTSPEPERLTNFSGQRLSDMPPPPPVPHDPSNYFY